MTPSIAANQISKDMGRKRDSKGRFIKGNEIGRENLKPFTREQAAEMGRKGSVKSAETKRRNKLLREVLMEQLDQEITTKNGEKITRREAIVAATLKNLYDKPSAKGLKIIAEVCGEMEININLTQSEKPVIMFDNGEDNVQ